MFKRRVTGKEKLNLKQKIVVIIMDVLLLAELTYSIYLGNQNPEYLAGIFLRTFIPMMIGTIVLARIFIKRFRTEEQVWQGPLGLK